MKTRDEFETAIGQAAYDSEVGDFNAMNRLLDEIMQLQEAAQHRVQPTVLCTCKQPGWDVNNPAICPTCKMPHSG